MFEDSVFESAGRIRTRSRGWMFATLVLNSSIVVGLILIPLVHPEALSHRAMSFLMAVPPPPPAAPPAPAQEVRRPASSDLFEGQLRMPRVIPPTIGLLAAPEPAAIPSGAFIDASSGTPGGLAEAFRPQAAPRVFHTETKGPARVPSALAAGLLLQKVVPVYPPLGRAMRAEGTVALAASISKEGRIVNLRVMSGPAVLQQAAIDAVSQWRYRPYLLNGEPVEVETTINVIFTLGG